MTVGVSGVVTAPGPRAAQEVLWQRAEEGLAPLRQHPQLLNAPLRIVVPSAPLRRHLQEELVRRRGSTVGVAVQTLFAIAREVLERAGERLEAVGEALLPVMVERFARREVTLAVVLEGFEGGYGCLVATVQDLLDAGFTPDHLEAVEECLLALGEEGERAAAVARVAAKAAAALAAEGVRRPAEALGRAAELLRQRPQLLPAQAVLVYGFADATALAADLLEALWRNGATVVLDLPPRPARPEELDLGASFTLRLRERLGGVPLGWTAAVSAPVGELAGFAATDAEDEARQVARRVRRLLEEGACPEFIGVVGRDLAPYREPLARHLHRLGVPFSAVGVAGPWWPWARRLRSALALLTSGGEAPAGALLTAMERGSPQLALALATARVGRVSELAQLDGEHLLGEGGGVTVPVAAGADEADGPGRRRGVGREELQWVRRAARALMESLERWEEVTTFAVHRRQLLELPAHLGWAGEGELAGAWAEMCSRLAGQVPPATLLTRLEVVALLESAAEGALRAGVGGQGGGVVVAPVMAVRGWTFSHLFVVGCNRGVFPRQGRQDPLLPDRLRAALLPLLPELPTKGDPLPEERYLFAQLCAASPAVTLSWRLRDENGGALAPSPLLAPLALSAPSGYGTAEGPWGSLELGCRVGVQGDRAALGEVWARFGPGGEDFARYRLAVLEEQDPPLDRLEWGPYLGFLGAPPDGRQRFAVTLLEGLGRCPWQTFLTSLLRLRRVADEEGRVAELENRALGTTVHAALASLLGQGGEEGVPAPSDAQLREAAREAAARVAAAEGVPALAGELAAVWVESQLRVARELLWGEGAVTVLGVEQEGVLRLEGFGQPWEVEFKADLVEATPQGERRTDFKTGRNPFAQGGEETRLRNYLTKVAQGENLQAAVYAAYGGMGRFLFLDPLQPPERARELTVRGDQVQLPLQAALAVLVPLWQAGAMFPRVESAADGREPWSCSSCEVREACWRGDSGVRRRLVQLARRVGPYPGAEVEPAVAAWVRGWYLPLARPDGER